MPSEMEILKKGKCTYVKSRFKKKEEKDRKLIKSKARNKSYNKNKDSFKRCKLILGTEQKEMFY